MTDVDVWAQRIAALKDRGGTNEGSGGVEADVGNAESTGADAVRRVLRLEADAPRAAILLADGYVSAHHVTARTRSVFVRDMGTKFGPDGRAAARRVYQKASLVQSRVAHMVAMLRGTVGSPQTRALTGRNFAPELEEHFQKLDNYQTLFGSLAYCSANGEATILSPAAYLADLLRVIDLAITQANPHIPAGLTLANRRPDLGNITLDDDNTYTEVPYLQFVVGILVETLAAALVRDGTLAGGDIFLTLATNLYPFNLPYNAALDQLRITVARDGTALANVYAAFAASVSAPSPVAPEVERLGLSIEALRNLAPPAPDVLAAVVSANYGLAITADNLGGMDHLAPFMAQTGLARNEVESLLDQGLSAREILDVGGSYDTTGLGPTMTLIQSGDRVSGIFGSGGTLSGVMSELDVRGTWSGGSPETPETGDLEMSVSADGSSFTGRWRVGHSGAWNPTALTGQRTGTASTAGIIPHSFFINKPLAVRHSLSIATQTVAGADVEVIADQALGTLDTINRFVRLAAVTGWSAADLDWVLNTLHAPACDASGNLTCVTELSSTTIVEVAKTQRLAGRPGLDLETVTSMWFDIRTIRCGTGPVSTAPFDILFNDPSALARDTARSVYHPKIAVADTSYVNPLYADPVLTWTVGAKDDGSRAASIVACLPGTLDDAASIAAAAFGAVTQVALTVPTLSLLYRHAALAKHLNLPVPSYLSLVRLLDLGQGGAFPATLDRDRLTRLLDAADWVAASGFSVANLAYLIDGTVSPYATTGYAVAAVPALVATLGAAVAPTALKPADFASPLVTPRESAAYLQVLRNSGFVDPIGLVRMPAGQAVDLSGVAGYDPAVAPPSPAQVAAVVTTLRQTMTAGIDAAAQAVASFFGASPDLTTVILAGTASWLGFDGLVEPLTLSSIAWVAPGEISTGGLPDLAKIAAVLAQWSDPVPAGAVLVPQAVATWAIDAGQPYRAVSPDLVSVSVYDDATPLFIAALDQILTDGVADPAKVVALFRAEGIDLPAGTTVTQVVVPLSWMIQDAAGSMIYCGQQRNGATSGVDISVPATARARLPGIAPALQIIDATARALVLTGAVTLSRPALATIFAVPQAFGIPVAVGGAPRPSFDAVRDVARFAQLVAAFGDHDDGLALYLAAAQATPDAGLDAQLSTVTGWSVDQLTFVRVCLFGTAADTVAKVAALAQVFTLAATLDTDVYTLHDVAATALQPATEAVFGSTRALAGHLLDALRSATPPDRWPTLQGRLGGLLLAHQRDALTPAAISRLGKTFADITTPDALYEFLLIDVEMSGCASISVVKEAINAAQLYLQRCRLNLEREVVISTDDLPDVWWQWLMNYRVWQANREIFLYPENYIDPSLRRNKTLLFQDLENGLLQGDVTADRVEIEYRKYLDGLATLAKLRIVKACHTVVHDAERGEIDTLFIFARTDTQPYKFHMMRREDLGARGDGNAHVWSEWLPVSITINAEQVTPVYAFDKLFLFWSELTEKRDVTGGTNDQRARVTTASLRYSFQNFVGDWMPPQTLAGDIPIEATISGVNLDGPFSRVFSSTPDSLWNGVGCLHVPAGAIAGPQGQGERLCIFFGPLIDAASGDGNLPPDPAPYAGSPAIAAFCSAVDEASLVWTQVKGLGLKGETPLIPVIVLDAALGPAPLLFQNQYTLLRGDAPSATAAPAVAAGLNGTNLLATSAFNTLVNNYIEGAGVTIPLVPDGAGQPLGNGAFANDNITTAQSQAFYAILTTAPTNLIDPATGKVASFVLTTTVAMLATALSIAPGIARQVREILLDSYIGSLVLLSQCGTGAASLVPVANQPGAFILGDGPQAFLVEARPPGGPAMPMIDEALAITGDAPCVTASTLITRDIDAMRASQFYKVLTTQPNIVIDGNGQVDTATLRNLSIGMLATALTTDFGRAQAVKTILLSGSAPASAAYTGDGFSPQDSLYSLQFIATRLTTGAIAPLSAALDAGGIDGLLALPRQQLPVDATQPFSDLGPTTATIAVGAGQGLPLLVPPDCFFATQVDFEGPYGLYYWEMFFHAPFLVAKMLTTNQHFDAAERWLQYIFDPTVAPDPLTAERFVALRPADVTADQAATFYTVLTTGQTQLIDASGAVLKLALSTSPALLAVALSIAIGTAREIKNLLVNQYLATPSSRYWQFAPLRNHTLQSLTDQLTDAAQIAAYNDDPFDPDAIARLRIGAYEKTVVIAYVKNLLAWGDNAFSQYSWESVTTARMLYSYAHDLLGPRPVAVGPCRQTVPTTFNAILARYGGRAEDIPQFLIELEGMLPGVPESGPLLAGAGKPYNDLGGVFVVPENEELKGLWDIVADRVYKIRNCLNIDGKPQALPLFQPPIDPMALVRAAAAGNNVLSILQQLQPKVPFYRFPALLQRAVAANDVVRSFGGALLQALQQNDAEALMAMTQTGEVAVLSMTTAMKRRAIEDQQSQLQSLQDALAGATYRQTYYNDLVSAGLNAAEISALTLVAAATLVRIGAMAINGISIAAYLAPNIFGLADGGMQFGDAVNAGAQIAGGEADVLGQGASIAQTAADFQRRAADWTLQGRLAGFEITQTTSEIAAATARLAGAQQDLAVNLRQVDDAQRQLTFIKTKFTNAELFQWMTGRLATLYFQSYRVSLDLALAAQTAYQYELDRDDAFIGFAYWDGLRQGLLAGEGLALALQQLESAYLDGSPRRLEIEKTISLRQACPELLVAFMWGYEGGSTASRKGQLDFALSQAMFDFDFPSHYCRKIKSISISMPCVIGPYQDLHATLTQNSDAVVLSPDMAAIRYVDGLYSAAGGAAGDPPPATVRQNWAPDQSIAVSQGVDDSGLFVLDFADERYLPFEGTGAVSSWTFSLPPDTNPIDFNAITDVIVKVRYTAKDGGALFAQQMRQFYTQRAADHPRLLNLSFSLARSYAEAWYQAFHTAPVEGRQTITVTLGTGTVLPNLRQVKLHDIVVQLQLAGGVTVSSGSGKVFLSLQVGGAPHGGVQIPIAANYGHIDAAAFGTAAFVGVPWRLAFDIANVPSELLTDGAIDPAKLVDLALVVTYSAAPF